MGKNNGWIIEMVETGLTDGRYVKESAIEMLEWYKKVYPLKTFEMYQDKYKHVSLITRRIPPEVDKID